MNRANWDIFAFGACFSALIALISAVFQPFHWNRAISAVLGLAAALLATFFAFRLRRATLRAVVAGFAGALAGAVLGLLLLFPLNASGLFADATAQFIHLVLPLLGAYIGLLVGVAKSDFILLRSASSDERAGPFAKILDTSVLIDGRITDVAESGFLEGKLVVPRFVLHELQLVADSADSAKRNRGRRGLDVVQRLQKIATLEVEISDEDFVGVREVDLKLIELAKLRSAKIVTNDFNLNKLAQVQGVEILNINELANSLKPIVLPGEIMRVFILKEGKEHNQGVAYLDDGTMVVVDNARRMISKTIDIVVTSVLQTTAGKMIFGRFDERAQSVPERITAASAGSPAN